MAFSGSFSSAIATAVSETGKRWRRRVTRLLICSILSLVLFGCVSRSGSVRLVELPDVPSNGEVRKLTSGRKGSINEVAPPAIFLDLNDLIQSTNRQPQVTIASPKPDQVIEETTLKVKINLRGFSIYKEEKTGQGPHLQVILDNQPAQSIYNLDDPIEFVDLAPGSHTLRVLTVKPWGESFKGETAYAQTTFHVFAKTGENTPNPNQPLLTYSEPQGTYGAEPILLDFHLNNAPLHRIAASDATLTDWRIRCDINGQSFIFDEWQPLYLKGFKPGPNWVQLTLIDEQGNPIDNAFNSTVRVITYDPNQRDTLAKMTRGELLLEDVGQIVDPTYEPPAKPEPIVDAEPVTEIPEAPPETPEAITTPVPAETTNSDELSKLDDEDSATSEGKESRAVETPQGREAPKPTPESGPEAVSSPTPKNEPEAAPPLTQPESSPEVEPAAIDKPAIEGTMDSRPAPSEQKATFDDFKLSDRKDDQAEESSREEEKTSNQAPDLSQETAIEDTPSGTVPTADGVEENIPDNDKTIPDNPENIKEATPKEQSQANTIENTLKKDEALPIDEVLPKGEILAKDSQPGIFDRVQALWEQVKPSQQSPVTTTPNRPSANQVSPPSLPRQDTNPLPITPPPITPLPITPPPITADTPLTTENNLPSDAPSKDNELRQGTTDITPREVDNEQQQNQSEITENNGNNIDQESLQETAEPSNSLEGSTQPASIFDRVQTFWQQINQTQPATPEEPTTAEPNDDRQNFTAPRATDPPNTIDKSSALPLDTSPKTSPSEPFTTDEITAGRLTTDRLTTDTLKLNSSNPEASSASEPIPGQPIPDQLNAPESSQTVIEFSDDK